MTDMVNGKQVKRTTAIHWQEQVFALAKEGSFDIATYVIENEIKKDPNNLDAYIILLYQCMDLFLENTCYWANATQDPLRDIKQEYYENKIWNEYKPMVIKYFDESYERFSSNPAYLYYAAKVLLPGAPLMGLADKEDLLVAMYEKAKKTGYNHLIEQGYSETPHDTEWATRILNSLSIQHQLATKGAAAQYVLENYLRKAQKIIVESNTIKGPESHNTDSAIL